MSLICFAMSLFTMRNVGQWRDAWTCGSVLAMNAALIVLCTLLAFTLMNTWQPALPAAEAALLYAAEPVFASLFALFLPKYLSQLTGVFYANEQLTPSLLVGGGLITLANVLVQLYPTHRPEANASSHLSPVHGVKRGELSPK